MRLLGSRGRWAVVVTACTVTAAGLVGTSSAAAGSPDNPDSPDRQVRVINGHDAAPGEVPSAVALAVRVDATRIRRCGGTLVAPSLVVTAAHCVVLDGQVIAAASARVTSGLDRQGTDSRASTVAAVAVHPGYQIGATTTPNDLAVVTLAEPLDGVPTTPVAGPAEAAVIAAPGARALTAGWGDTTWGEGVSASWLQVAELYIHPGAKCASRQTYTVAGTTYVGRGSGVDPATMICAAATTSTGALVHPYKGDSGGPLVVTVNGGQRLVGAVSYGSLSEPTVPVAAVYTRLSAFAGWLSSLGVPVTDPPPFEPDPDPTPDPSPSPPADTVAPVVTAFVASGRRGQTIELRYRVKEVSRLTRESVKVKDRYGRVVWTTQTGMGRSDPDTTYYTDYRVPRNATSGKWCVRSTDPAGNRSTWSCAALRVR
ncbi:MAG: serine protease [Candidatus Nanopelagicales bacterium]